MLNEYYSDISILILIYVSLAASLNLLMGYAGQFSMAQAAFYGIGAYAAGILTVNHGWQSVLSVVGASAVALLFATIVSIPATKRVKGEYLILLTLAFQMVVFQLMNSLRTLTGGPYGFTVPWLHLFGRNFIAPSEFLPVMIVVTVVVVAICWGLGESPFGRLLKGIREDETAVRALGKNTIRAKLLIFGITAGLAGLVGAVSAFYYQFIAPGAYNLDLSIFIVSIVVLGGIGNLTGTVIAAIILGGLHPLLQNLSFIGDENSFSWQAVIYGSALVVLMRFRPQGLLPEGLGISTLFRLGRIRQASGSRRRGDAAAMAASPRRIEPASPARETTMSPALASSSLIFPRAAQPIEAEAPQIVRMHDLAKRFGGIFAVNGMTMGLRECQITALIGPNGAGKTTIFNLMTGALKPDRGTVVLRGTNITGMTPNDIARLGIARSFQDVRLFGRMTVLQNVALAAPNQVGENLVLLTFQPRQSRRIEASTIERARHYLELVKMGHKADDRVANLSYGEKKLVAIARLLATECEVLLLDEPTSGIDPASLDGMINLVLRLRDFGRTVCIVEHSLYVVEQLADHVVFMEEGRVTAEGAIADLKQQERLVEVYFGT